MSNRRRRGFQPSYLGNKDDWSEVKKCELLDIIRSLPDASFEKQEILVHGRDLSRSMSIYSGDASFLLVLKWDNLELRLLLARAWPESCLSCRTKADVVQLVTEWPCEHIQISTVVPVSYGLTLLKRRVSWLGLLERRVYGLVPSKRRITQRLRPTWRTALQPTKAYKLLYRACTRISIKVTICTWFLVSFATVLVAGLTLSLRWSFWKGDVSGGFTIGTFATGAGCSFVNKLHNRHREGDRCRCNSPARDTSIELGTWLAGRSQGTDTEAN